MSVTDLLSPTLGAAAAGCLHLRGQGQAIETVRRSGKFGAQLTRLENAGVTAFIHLRNDNGVITRGETRTLGGSD